MKQPLYDTQSLMHVWILFAVYGPYNGLTEGVEKALVACIAAGLFWLMANPMLIILLTGFNGNAAEQQTAGHPSGRT